ncbi:hypothetical protein BJ170DRAFT_686870 [Xylariales sp. AK1849]|nr:hypothetical protein BJ170DRAFT_686870 [Xylariales sp. AK1849]
MHSSAFSYSVTRQYPFKWFTPVVIIGGIIVTALISFVNVATSGYELVATASNHPNRTAVDPTWYGNIKWPSYFIGNTRASCAPATFPLKTEIFTNNHVIPYTISNVWRWTGDGAKVNLGSLVYQHNVLQNCNVTRVTIQVLGREDQSIDATAISRVGLALTTSASCSVDVDTSQTDAARGPTFFELTGTYNLLDAGTPRFLLRNATEKGSLYWGESLIRMYWMVLAKAYYDGAVGTTAGNTTAYKAAITLERRSEAATGTKEEVMDDDFFKVSCFTEDSFCGNDSITWLAEGHKQWDPYPGIWLPASTLGKAMWFAVMTDLGRNDSAVPNMLTYPDLLENLSQNLTNEVQYWESRRLANNNSTTGVHLQPNPGLALESFNPSKSPQPRLGASPAYLATNYICQVPQAKQAGTLFLSVLVADLVLLQAIWLVFRFIVDGVLQRRYPAMRYCEGCYKIKEQDATKLSMDPDEASRGLQSGRQSASGSEVELVRYAHLGQVERQSD